MRMLHFSADNGTQEVIWFTDETSSYIPVSPEAIAEDLNAYFRKAEWSLDWEVEVEDITAIPTMETPYFKSE